MISPEDITRAKQVSIPEYLLQLGYLPIKQSNQELQYSSPLRVESSASFFVNLEKNIFKDFGEDEFKGDIIRLCQTLEKCTFIDAVNRLLNLSISKPNASFSFSGIPLKKESNNSFEITAVKPLRHQALIHYVEGRGIPYVIADRYLQEVHYYKADRKYFSVGFKNDLGGYTLRNGAGFKGQTQPAGITTIPGTRTDIVCLFEGFFDYLSALVYYGRNAPIYTTIILNSTTNLSKAMPQLKAYKQINAFLDQDEAGRKSVEKLEKTGLSVNNCTSIYADFKDFNEFLVRK